MSISLQKGQKVSLTKESKEGLNKVIVGLGSVLRTGAGH